MRRYVAVTLFLSTLVMIGCSPIERQAYQVTVGAKAFLDSVKKAHPECTAATVSTLCSDLARATASKDLLIDAVEVYCSGPQFESGGACQPPAKGTPAAQQAVTKLKAAIATYNRSEKDLRGAL